PIRLRTGGQSQVRNTRTTADLDPCIWVYSDQMLGSAKPDVEARLRAQGISPESARAQMEKILSSEGFAHSERLSRFLRFAVDQALDGKAGELKEYVLA